MKLLFTLMILVAAAKMGSASAADLGLQFAEFTTGKFYNKRDPYFPCYQLERQRDRGPCGEYWTHRIGLETKSVLYRYGTGVLYWDQFIYGDSTTHQYREAALQAELGWRWSFISMFWNHESRHHLEGMAPDDSTTPNSDPSLPPYRGKSALYPLRDYYGVKWCLYGCWRNK